MDIIFTEEQQKAVDCALAQDIMILTGGPGTGKTTTCSEIINQLEAQGKKVVCAAPTGKASKRLQEQTDRPASTIHRLLKWTFEANGFTVNRENPLTEDVVLLDETSMVDLELIHAVLDAMRPGTKLILVGDADQLPSISAGNVLRDIITSKTVHVARLTEVHRHSPNSWIHENAKRINHGKQIHIDNEHSEDFFFIERETGQQTAQTIVRLVTLNPELQYILNPPGPDKAEWKINDNTVFREGDRVIHIKNNYNLGVFNGEVGTIADIGKTHMNVDFGDRDIDYDRLDAMQLQLCYASTIHKSQGSEYPCVVIACHSTNWFMLSRPLIYTAVTRAQKYVYLVGDKKGIYRAIQNNKIVQRYTSLKERLEQKVTT